MHCQPRYCQFEMYRGQPIMDTQVVEAPKNMVRILISPQIIRLLTCMCAIMLIY